MNPKTIPENTGQQMNEENLFHSQGLGAYLTLSGLALFAVALIMYLIT
jgi:hypothetical protein